MSLKLRWGITLAALYGAALCVRVATADLACDGTEPQGASNCGSSQDCPNDCPKAGGEYAANKCQSLYRASNNYASGCSGPKPNSNTLCKTFDDGTYYCYNYFGCYHKANSDVCEFDPTASCSFPQVVVTVALSIQCTPGS